MLENSRSDFKINLLSLDYNAIQIMRFSVVPEED